MRLGSINDALHENPNISKVLLLFSAACRNPSFSPYDVFFDFCHTSAEILTISQGRRNTFFQIINIMWVL